MAKIERITRIKDNEFDFDDLLSFQTKNFIGERVHQTNAFVIFDKMWSQHLNDKIDTIYANNLEDLINEVEYKLEDKIIEVYDELIITLSINI